MFLSQRQIRFFFLLTRKEDGQKLEICWCVCREISLDKWLKVWVLQASLGFKRFHICPERHFPTGLLPFIYLT